ncbi:hypothetical protein LEP1GSC017_0194 [Leptospira meyeri serovar Hardjo str. Went 5]|nr:hypothetical protein LEP1GSC017_0194 [Leptospira meyeri serovar Hardjo str. Went 5]
MDVTLAQRGRTLPTILLLFAFLIPFFTFFFYYKNQIEKELKGKT